MSQSRARVRKLAVAAMLSAIAIIMGVTPLGFIPLFGVSATLMHIPVIIGALMEGAGVGSLVGLVFGGFSCCRAWLSANPADWVFRNPLVAVLPRLLIAPATYFSHRLAARLLPGKPKLCWGIAAAVGSLTNTFVTLTAMAVVQPTLFMTDGQSAAVLLKAIGLVIATNGLAECALAVVLSVALMTALSRTAQRAK